MDVTIRILQIDGQSEIRLNPQGGKNYQRYNLTPQQLLNIAIDALDAYNQIRFGEGNEKKSFK